MTPAGATQERVAKRRNGLRANALAAIVMLLVVYALGVIAGVVPASRAPGRGLPAIPAVWAVVTQGPAVVSVHAVIGTLLVTTGVSALARAAVLRRAGWSALCAAALAGILAAWIAGAALAGHYSATALLTMALADAAAIACYAILLFRLPRTPRAR